VSSRVALSIVVPVKNEAARLEPFLRRLAWADEIVIADNGSTDESAAIARANGAVVLELPTATLPELRNRGIEAARNRWILSLDADESVTPDLVTELTGVTTAADGPRGFKIRRRNFYLGREQRRGSDWIVRLFQRDLRYRPGRVHEQLEAVTPLGALTGTILHEQYRDLDHHLEKMNQYARWGAEDLWDRGRRAGFAELTIRPAWRFVESYFLEGNFLDGRFGLVISVLGTFAGFLKWAHLWAMEQQRDPRPPLTG
jgi:glycosyltransferase involved in cell wall biosynthesis